MMVGLDGVCRINNYFVMVTQNLNSQIQHLFFVAKIFN